jgi:hypothetical protein
VAAGSLQNILVCMPVGSADQASAVDQQVCRPSSGQHFRLQAYQAYVISPASAGYLDSVTQPFDYAQAAGFWGLAFTTVIGLWLVSVGAGAIVNFVRRA